MARILTAKFLPKSSRRPPPAAIALSRGEGTIRRRTLGGQLTLVLVGVTLALHLMLIAIDRLAEIDKTRQRDRDLVPADFATVVPELLKAPVDLRQAVVKVFSDPANYYVLGAEPVLLEEDAEDAEFASTVLGWAQRTGLPVTEVLVAERTAPALIRRRNPGIEMERSALFDLGEAPRVALFEGDPDQVPHWVTGEDPDPPADAGPPQPRPERVLPQGRQVPPGTAGGTPGDGRPGPIMGPLMGLWHGIRGMFHSTASTQPKVHTIAMRLAETGDWLTLYRLERTPPANVSITKIIASVPGTFAVAGIGILVGRRVMRPFRRLAVSADRIGRGERGETVPVAGPEDVREIIAAFNRMGERVAQSTDYQIGLLRSLGHDLKGPLAAMRQMLGTVGPETTRQQIEDRLERALGIIGSIMEFSRATMRDGEMEETDLAALVEAIVEEQAELGRDATADLPEPLFVSCRYNAVERMLRNVVENAIKYGGSARASLAVEGDEAVIRVDDSGPGIPQSELEAVFAPFRRIATGTEGTGLGLAIARTIAIDHGGSVRLAHRPGGRLRAEIRLPLGA